MVVTISSQPVSTRLLRTSLFLWDDKISFPRMLFYLKIKKNISLHGKMREVRKYDIDFCNWRENGVCFLCIPDPSFWWHLKLQKSKFADHHVSEFCHKNLNFSKLFTICPFLAKCIIQCSIVNLFTLKTPWFSI